jgi:hypothetical protein
MISEKLVARELVIKIGVFLIFAGPQSKAPALLMSMNGVYRIDLKAQRSNPVQDAATGAPSAVDTAPAHLACGDGPLGVEMPPRNQA